MDEIDFTPDIEKLRQQIQSVDREIARLTAKRDALGHIVRGYEMLTGLDADEEPVTSQEGEVPAIRAPNGVVPRGREAVLAIMREQAPGYQWNQLDVARRIKEKGWFDPEAKDPVASVRVTLRRMAQAGELEKVRDATYRIPVATPDASPTDREEVARLIED